MKKNKIAKDLELARAKRAAVKGDVIKINVEGKFTCWLVRSSKGDKFYIIIPERFCSCSNFIFRKILKRGKPCYHLLAQRYAAERGLEREVKISWIEFEEKYFRKIVLGILS